MGRHIFYTYVYITTTKSSIGCIFSKDDVRRYLKQLGTICAEKNLVFWALAWAKSPISDLVCLFVCCPSLHSQHILKPAIGQCSAVLIGQNMVTLQTSTQARLCIQAGVQFTWHRSTTGQQHFFGIFTQTSHSSIYVI